MENKKIKHKKSLEKMRFYDKSLIAALIAFLSLFSFSFMDGFVPENILFFIFIIIISVLSISGAVFGWGMLYHQYKSKDNGWLTFSILTFFLASSYISFLMFYFVKMRKEFQKGKGVYN